MWVVVNNLVGVGGRQEGGSIGDGGFHSGLASVFCVGGERQRERMTISSYFMRVATRLGRIVHGCFWCVEEKISTFYFLFSGMYF